LLDDELRDSVDEEDEDGVAVPDEVELPDSKLSVAEAEPLSAAVAEAESLPDDEPVDV